MGHDNEMKSAAVDVVDTVYFFYFFMALIAVGADDAVRCFHLLRRSAYEPAAPVALIRLVGEGSAGERWKQ